MVQGFYFALLQYSHTQAFTACFALSMQLYRQRCKTSHRALQALFLWLVPFYSRRYQTDTSGYNAVCATLKRITAPQHLQRIPDTRRHAGRCTAQHRPPIIIMYIRVRPLLWIHARQCSILQTMPARRLAIWHRVSSQGAPAGTLHPAGQSSGRGAAGGAEPLTATAVSLFGLSPDSQ